MGSPEPQHCSCNSPTTLKTTNPLSSWELIAAYNWSMQKRILSIFSPFLIAILVRIIYVLWGYGYFCVDYVAEDIGWAKSHLNSIGFFDTFKWDESWHYWIVVLFLTFLAEMDIWRDIKDEKQNRFLGHSIYAIFFLGFIVISIVPSLTSFLYTSPVAISNLFNFDEEKSISATLYNIFNSTEQLKVISNIFWANFVMASLAYIFRGPVEDEFFPVLAIIIASVFYILPLFPIVSPTSGYIALNVLGYSIYLILWSYSITR